MRRERALKIVLVVVGLLFTALVYPLVVFVKQEPCAGNDAQPLRHTRHILAAGSPKSIRQSEPHRVHGMVELRPRSSYGGASSR